MTPTRRVRQWTRASLLVPVLIAALVMSPTAAGASQAASWGWTTHADPVMSFFGGIPYRGCEKATLTLPDAGSGGWIYATTR